MEKLYKTFHKVQSFVLKSKATFQANFIRGSAKPIPEVRMILEDGATRLKLVSAAARRPWENDPGAESAIGAVAPIEVER
jgi:hypothetical protein